MTVLFDNAKYHYCVCKVAGIEERIVGEGFGNFLGSLLGFSIWILRKAILRWIFFLRKGELGYNWKVRKSICSGLCLLQSAIKSVEEDGVIFNFAIVMGIILIKK